MLYTFPHELDYEVGPQDRRRPCRASTRCASPTRAREATQAAIRLARAYTGKDKILKWEGSYNGFLDCHAFSHVPAARGRRHRALPAHRCRRWPASRATFEDMVIVGCFNDLDSAERSSSRTPPSWPPC